MILSTEQQSVCDHLMEWYARDRSHMQYVTVGGYAGTGKTTLIAALRGMLAEKYSKMKICYVSYTGKAARVLQDTFGDLIREYPQDTIGTIHSLIYSPVLDDRQQIAGWRLKEKVDCDLIIVDEGSMVDEVIWRHLLSYRIGIIVVGDHGQLPPINGNFNLLSKPDLVLNTIYRQAAISPIIDISYQARSTGVIRPGAYSDCVIKFSPDDPDGMERMNELLASYDDDTLVLCGYNKTRVRLNAHIRSTREYESADPVVGDRVICLKNNHKKNIYNGMIGTILMLSPLDGVTYDAEIEMDGQAEHYRGIISATQFNAETSNTTRSTSIGGSDVFDYGYALTVHKAQGSQARRVILFEERMKKMDESEWRRWLYTAVTRAQEELYIFPGR